MDAFEILSLIFAIILCLLTVLNILFNSPYNSLILYLDRTAIIDNLAVSIIIMAGACVRLSAGIYKACMILLIITDALSFIYMILFLILYYYFWVKLINLFIITPLIIFIDKIRKKREKMSTINREIAVGSTIVAQNAPLPNNNQPGYIQIQTPNVSNTYQPPS